MANCQGSETREGKSGVNPNDILDEREMTTERGTYQRMVDDFLTVGRDIQEEYGTAVGEFLISRMKGSTQAIAYYDGENIAINEKYINEKVMNSAYKECIDIEWHPSNGNKSATQAVAAHEFGHALTDLASKKTGTKGIEQTATFIVNEARKSTKHKGVVKMARKISRYATSSNAEAIAEAFSDVYCNGKNAQPESTAIVNVLNKYTKGP